MVHREFSSADDLPFSRGYSAEFPCQEAHTNDWGIWGYEAGLLPSEGTITQCRSSSRPSPTPDSLDFTWGNILTSLFPVLLPSLLLRFFPKSLQSNALGVQWSGEMLRYPTPQKKSHIRTNPYFRIHFFETYLKTLGPRSSPRKLTLRRQLLTRQTAVTFLPWREVEYCIRGVVAVRFLRRSPHEFGQDISRRGCADSHGFLCCSVAKSCLTLCDPTYYSPPCFFVRGVCQARVLERVIISFSRGSSQPRDWTYVSYVPCISRQILCHWATSSFPHLGEIAIRRVVDKV